MKLKCIDGPNAGDYGYTYDDKPRIGETVRISQEKKVKVSDYMPSYEEIPKIVTIEYAIYIVDINQGGLFLRHLP